MKKRNSSKRRKSKRNNAQLKKNVRQALHGLYAISLAFTVLLVVSLTFLLYQWKDYTITEYAKDIQQINASVLKLKSENSRYHSRINSDLLKYSQIARISREKLELKPSVQKSVAIKVDKNKLDYYANKDREKK